MTNKVQNNQFLLTVWFWISLEWSRS